jgi:hypothetical protein
LSWKEEDRLLLYFCCRGIDKRTKHKIVKAEMEGLDWDIFLEKARENGISPIVYSKLEDNKFNFLNIPSEIFEGLKEDYYLNVRKNTLIFEELRKALKAFRESGLQVMVLKGAALAEKVYGSIALRPMADIDLLVKKEDLKRLDEQLKMLGYQASDMLVDNIDFSSTYLTTLDYRSSSENSISFHIHWHFVNSTIPSESYIKNIRMVNIWENAEKIKVADVETLVMAPHHLIIHLSEHALRVTHSLSKLSFLCDISEAVNYYKGRLDWDRLIKESLEFNLNRMVYLSLYFASEFLEAQIPEDVLTRLKPKRFSLWEKIFMNAISNNNRFPGLSYLVHFSINKGLLNKMKFIWRTFFPPRQFLAQRNYIPLSEVKFAHYLRRANEVFSRFFKVLG